MKSLFVRIFVSYWIAQALFFMLAFAVASALRPSRDMANFEAEMPRFFHETLQAYQSGGETGTWRYLRSLHESHHVRLYVFDAQGKELLARTPPEWIERARLGKLASADSFWARFRAPQFLRSVQTANGQQYTMIMELPPEPHPLFGPNGVPGLGLLIGIISSGLVCYLLAWYLTAPVVRLRAATQKLAAGDLTARAGVPGSRRHDEMAQLTQDFDLMAERLQNLISAQRRLLSDISHELRSPLARLNIALELARQRSGTDARSALDRIDRETNRLNEMIGRLLTIARLEAGSQAIEKSPVRLAQVVDEIARDAAFEAQSRGCEVKVTIADDCVVYGSAGLLHSAIENVVRNAIRYTQEGTSVQVSLEQAASPPAEAIVQVQDSGPGVPDEALDKLFQPFYRIDDARGRQTGGVGLGLAITQRAVSLHGGTVRAVNRPQGGLMVEIRLPLAFVEVSEPATPTTSSSVISGRQG